MPFYKILLCATTLLTPFVVSAQSSTQSSTLSPSGYAFGASQVCQLESDGSIECSVRDGFRRLLPPADLPPLTTITLGDTHACGLGLDGQAVCWGDNIFGQLSVPLGSTEFVQIDAGQNHTCALDISGEATCWGLNSNRQTEPPEGARFQKLELTTMGSCGILDSGELSCWGNDGPFVNQALSESGPFIDIDASGRRVCGIREEGDVSCNIANIPLEGGPFSDLAVDPVVPCGLDQDSRLQCNLDFAANSDVFPIGEQFLSIHSVEGGTSFNSTSMCGERLDGTLQCWNDSGRIPLPSDDDNSPISQLDSQDLEMDARIHGALTELFFTPIDGIGSPDLELLIFRNGELIDRVDSRFSYVDRAPEVDNIYQIQLIDEQGNVGPLSDVLSVNTETGTVLFRGEPALSESISDVPDSQRLIVDANLVGLFGGYIAFWSIDPEVALNNPVDRYEIRIGGVSAGFTRSRLLVENSESLRSRCIEIFAIGTNGSVIDTAQIGNSCN